MGRCPLAKDNTWLDSCRTNHTSPIFTTTIEKQTSMKFWQRPEDKSRDRAPQIESKLSDMILYEYERLFLFFPSTADSPIAFWSTFHLDQLEDLKNESGKCTIIWAFTAVLTGEGAEASAKNIISAISLANIVRTQRSLIPWEKLIVLNSLYSMPFYLYLCVVLQSFHIRRRVVTPSSFSGSPFFSITFCFSSLNSSRLPCPLYSYSSCISELSVFSKSPPLP
jgi:hypothetical protein